MEDTPHSLTRKIRALNKVFRLACSQVILLNHRIEAVKARYDRACAVKRLSFRYCNRLKLTSLQGVRNVIYEYVIQKSEEIENLQMQLVNLIENEGMEYEIEWEEQELEVEEEEEAEII